MFASFVRHGYGGRHEQAAALRYYGCYAILDDVTLLLLRARAKYKMRRREADI